MTGPRCAQRSRVTRSCQNDRTLIRIVLRDSNVTIPTCLVITHPSRIDKHPAGKAFFSLESEGFLFDALQKKPLRSVPGDVSPGHPAPPRPVGASPVMRRGVDGNGGALFRLAREKFS